MHTDDLGSSAFVEMDRSLNHAFESKQATFGHSYTALVRTPNRFLANHEALRHFAPVDNVHDCTVRRGTDILVATRFSPGSMPREPSL